MKHCLLLFAFSLCAAAQTIGLPQNGVLLVGSPEVPVLKNMSGRPILAYAVVFHPLAGQGPVDIQWFVYPTAYLPDGATHQIDGATDKKNVKTVQIPEGAKNPPGFFILKSPVVSASLDGVLFADGEFDGPNTGNVFSDAMAVVKDYRKVGQLVTLPSPAWDQVTEYAENFTDDARSDDHHLGSAAKSLLQERRLNGDASAVAVANFFVSLPTPHTKVARVSPLLAWLPKSLQEIE